MLYKNEEAFGKALKGTTPQGLFLLYGSEVYLIDSWAKKLSARFGGDFASFNMQKLDGRKPSCDALADAVETLPLMAQEKCVLLDDLDPKALSAGEMESLFEILQDLPDSCTLIITAKPGVFDAKSAAGKKLIALCEKSGAAVQLGARGAAGMVTFLRGAAKKQGCELSPELARYILQTLESDMSFLSREMEKICAYSGGGAITREQIDAVAIPRTEARVFDLSKAILAGNAQRAIELLRDLFSLREPPVMIVAVLSMSYADLYRVRVAKDAGKTPADVVAAFGYKGREYRVNNAWNNRLSKRALRTSLAVLFDCDRRLKSTGIDGRVLLEQAVVRLLSLRASG